MKTIKYVPSQAKGENPGFSGHVELKMPLFEERLRYLELLNVEIDDAGTVDVSNHRKNVDTLIVMLETARKHYVSVDMKHLASGEEYKTYEDLSSDPVCQNILTEISRVVFNGVQMGNA